MKKKFTLLFILTYSISFSQQDLSNNKEYSDYLLNYNLNSIDYSPTDPPTLCNNVAWLMMDLLNMYETTGDKAYLLKFIDISSQTILKRLDVVNNFGHTWPPKWTLISDNTNQERTYFNTLVNIPMAKFVYLIKNVSILENSFLSINNSTPSLNIDVIKNDLIQIENKFNLIISSLSTYGDYADWLGARVEETMKYLDDHYWNDSFGHVKFLGEQNAAELNFQSSFATLYLWMYKINHSFSTNALSHSHIHDRLEILKNKYNALFFRHCISNGIGGSTIEFVFNEINSNGNQLFVWSHWGWRDYGCDTRWKEDLAHGATDLWFPITDYQLGQEFFTEDQLFYN